MSWFLKKDEDAERGEEKVVGCRFLLMFFSWYELLNYKNWLFYSSWLFLTQRATRRLNSGYDSLHCFAASTFAGDSSFGSASIEITDIIIVSTVWTGSQRSEAFSYPHLSSPGSCRMLMQTKKMTTMMIKKSFQKKFYVTHRHHSDQYSDATSLSRTSSLVVSRDILSGSKDVLEISRRNSLNYLLHSWNAIEAYLWKIHLHREYLYVLWERRSEHDGTWSRRKKCEKEEKKYFREFWMGKCGLTNLAGQLWEPPTWKYRYHPQVQLKILQTSKMFICHARNRF